MNGLDPDVLAFSRRAGLGETPTSIEVVQAIRGLPYGRPTHRTVQCVVAEWRASCSMKHELLVRTFRQHWPELDLRLVHRVYQLTRDAALSLFGDGAARHVPGDGLVDVHTYAHLIAEGLTTRLDVTFDGPRWDGRSDMPLACGDGQDFEALGDPWAQKEELVRTYCDPKLREPFLAALAAR